MKTIRLTRSTVSAPRVSKAHLGLNLFMVALLALSPSLASGAERQTKKTPALREKIYKVLSEAQAAAEANKQTDALKTLDRLKKNSSLNNYEMAMMWKFYAYIYYSQDKYDQAINAYEQVLKQDALPEALETEALYSTAQLYFVKENYKKAIEYINRWFALVDSPKPQAYIMLGQAYYQTGEMNKALKPIQNAISMEENKGKIPKESWYLLLRAIYFEKNDYKSAAVVMEKLVKHYPKKEYWVQLSAAYGELKQETKQLSALEIAYRQDLLDKENEWLTLAQLLLNKDVPYKAAKVLQRGMDKGIIKQDKDNLKLLSYAWSTAQEAKKALPVLEQAAKTSKSGEIDIQLGSTYYQLDKWQEATSYLRKGLKKGVSKNQDNAFMVLGLSLFNLNQFEDALYAFKQAAKTKRSKASASQWISYVESEIARRDVLAKTLKAMEGS